jgi:hypothetical protein
MDSLINKFEHWSCMISTSSNEQLTCVVLPQLTQKCIIWLDFLFSTPY